MGYQSVPLACTDVTALTQGAGLGTQQVTETRELAHCGQASATLPMEICQNVQMCYLTRQKRLPDVTILQGYWGV